VVIPVQNSEFIKSYRPANILPHNSTGQKMLSHLISQFVVVIVVSAVGLILYRAVRVSRLLP
jgi:hypothetical protein